MSPSNKTEITMEGTARKVVKRCLQFVNLILCIVGIAILMYSIWMIFVVLRQYRTYLFSSWFLWTSIITGIIFCFTSCIGFAGAATKRSKTMLSFYTFCIFMVLLMEILVIGDVILNKDWEKDFPADPAHRFEDFMLFVNTHQPTFKYVVLSTFLLQVIAFFLAMVLNVLDGVRSYHDNDAIQGSADFPFLAHKVEPIIPYAMGHPLPDDDTVDDSYTAVKINSMSSEEKEASVVSTGGCPPPTCV